MMKFLSNVLFWLVDHSLCYHLCYQRRQPLLIGPIGIGYRIKQHGYLYVFLFQISSCKTPWSCEFDFEMVAHELQ